eukprot:TRINITY_DN10107_c0_g1_i3.p1 TRINITY_DN10107_c0_g1~~TRINITY_DN10107_c0_g1_i3.p1  ORF type:complete len:372 (+),score=74.82 TRINITY_DN10107_c0_g1_i3:108-1223(+)
MMLSSESARHPAEALFDQFVANILVSAGFTDIATHEASDELATWTALDDCSLTTFGQHRRAFYLPRDACDDQNDNGGFNTTIGIRNGSTTTNGHAESTAMDDEDDESDLEPHGPLDFRIDCAHDSTCLDVLSTAGEFFIQELAHRAQLLASNAARSALTERDVLAAYQNLGLPLQSLQNYNTKYKQIQEDRAAALLRQDVPEVEVRPLPVPQTLPKVLKDESLRKDRPGYMPTHLPDYPDPHTFVRTATYEPTETSYVSYRQRRAKQQYDARNALIHVVARPGAGDLQLTGKGQLPPLKVIVEPLKVRNPYAHLKVQTELELPEPEVDDSDLSLNRVLKFENDMDAQAAHEARLEVKVEMIGDDYQPKNRA